MVYPSSKSSKKSHKNIPGPPNKLLPLPHHWLVGKITHGVEEGQYFGHFWELFTMVGIISGLEVE